MFKNLLSEWRKLPGNKDAVRGNTLGGLEDLMNLVEEIDRAIGGYEEGAWVPESDEIIKLVGLLSSARKEIATQQSVQSDSEICTCENVSDGDKGTFLVCLKCLKPRRR